MPAEMPVDYGKKTPTPKELVDSNVLVPVVNEGSSTPPQIDWQAIIAQAIKDALQNGGLTPTPQPSATPWKQLLLTLSKPRNVALVVLLVTELFTRVTHTVVPPETIQTILDYVTMLSTVVVAYKSDKHSLV